MSFFKYLAKLMNKCQEVSSKKEALLEIKKPKSDYKSSSNRNLITRTTIINQRRQVSNMIECYSHFADFKLDQVNKSIPNSDLLTPFKSELTKNESICNSCQQIPKQKEFCKCCGKQLIKKSKVLKPSSCSNKEKSIRRLKRQKYNFVKLKRGDNYVKRTEIEPRPNSTQIYEYNTENIIYKTQTIQQEQQVTLKKYSLKRSKAMVHIKPSLNLQSTLRTKPHLSNLKLKSIIIFISIVNSI